jgi:hypothetical protein
MGGNPPTLRLQSYPHSLIYYKAVGVVGVWIVWITLGKREKNPTYGGMLSKLPPYVGVRGKKLSTVGCG